jgi:aspartokinase-like uncharacterized kinase
MSLDAVLKVGGSLGRSEGLPRLCRAISRLGESHPVLVVPGGGEFADLVRKSYRTYGLGETAAHCMALLAMDQFGYLLHYLIENSSLETDVDSAAKASGSGRVAVLLPSATVLRDSRLPHSWDVTSDTVAAWVACRAGCRRLVLLKDVDGLMLSDGTRGFQPGCVGEMSVAQLAGHSGGVDRHLARFLASTRLETWVISGLKPERMDELMRSGSTTGTRIVAG